MGSSDIRYAEHTMIATTGVGYVPYTLLADQPTRKGAATMKLTTTTMVTVDGVMQGLGAPDEDRRGDSSAADGKRRCSTTRPGRF